MNDETTNLSKTERVVRVIIGIVVFVFGIEINNISGLSESGYFVQGSLKFVIASNINHFRNAYRVLAWFLGFVLFFTGSTGFCPIYKIIRRRGAKK